MSLLNFRTGVFDIILSIISAVCRPQGLLHSNRRPPNRPTTGPTPTLPPRAYASSPSLRTEATGWRRSKERPLVACFASAGEVRTRLHRVEGLKGHRVGHQMRDVLKSHSKDVTTTYSFLKMP